MGTSKPLKELIPKILQHIANQKNNLEFNFRLYKILEGQIRKEIEDSLYKEIISEQAYRRAIQRIPSINILKRSTDKVSKVYVEPPVRMAKNQSDKEILNELKKEISLDEMMEESNKFYNGLHSFALEPFIDEGKHKIRLLAPHQFLPFSDDLRDPTKMTVFIKMLGHELIFPNETTTTRQDVTSRDGYRQDENKRPQVIYLYALYSDSEYMIIDSGGAVRTDKMMEINGTTSTKNPFGRIPFIYGKKSKVELIPYPNQVGLDIAILIPKLLTDLNYAVQFLSHSIIWSKNADLGNQELNPDAIVDLGDTDSEGGQPEIGTIKPEVDITNQISLIEFQLQSYFDSIGIKVKTDGTLGNGRDSSALAKAIDEGDVTSEKKAQTKFFKKVERELWGLLADMQKVWSRRGDVKEKRRFTEGFKDDLNVIFKDMQNKTMKQKLDEIQLQREQKLITRKQAIKMLHPDLTEKQVNDWIKELEDEAQQDMERGILGLPTSQPERNSDGTFNEGNTAAADQTTESKDTEMVEERAETFRS